MLQEKQGKSEQQSCCCCCAFLSNNCTYSSVSKCSAEPPCTFSPGICNPSKVQQLLSSTISTWNIGQILRKCLAQKDCNVDRKPAQVERHMMAKSNFWSMLPETDWHDWPEQYHSTYPGIGCLWQTLLRDAYHHLKDARGLLLAHGCCTQRDALELPWLRQRMDQW